jgi:hypothetical protein
VIIVGLLACVQLNAGGRIGPVASCRPRSSDWFYMIKISADRMAVSFHFRMSGFERPRPNVILSGIIDDLLMQRQLN